MRSWNESTAYIDSATGKQAKILTSNGEWNIGPPYHCRGAFSNDSRYSVLCLQRNGGSGLVRVDLVSGYLEEFIWLDKPVLDGNFALHESTSWVIAKAASQLIAVHAQTCEQRILIDDIGKTRILGCPAWSLSGDEVFITNMPRRSPNEYPPTPAQYEKINLHSGERTVIWEDPLGGNNHIQVCPSDSDWLLIDRDFSPGYAWYGDYRATTRSWLFNHRTCELVELRPNNEWRFQMHTNFNHDGTRIYYHGRACPEPGLKGDIINETPQYVGVCDLSGRVIWEYIFPKFFYGHVSPHRLHEAIIIDGTLSLDLLCVLYYTDSEPDKAPIIQLLGRHESTWDRTKGQSSHPHPNMSPDGRWLLFNRSTSERSEVCVIDCYS